MLTQSGSAGPWAGRPSRGLGCYTPKGHIHSAPRSSATYIHMMKFTFTAAARRNKARQEVCTKGNRWPYYTTPSDTDQGSAIYTQGCCRRVQCCRLCITPVRFLGGWRTRTAAAAPAAAAAAAAAVAERTVQRAASIVVASGCRVASLIHNYAIAITRCTRLSGAGGAGLPPTAVVAAERCGGAVASPRWRLPPTAVVAAQRPAVAPPLSGAAGGGGAGGWQGCRLPRLLLRSAAALRSLHHILITCCAEKHISDCPRTAHVVLRLT
jgi:hypothetical protein